MSAPVWPTALAPNLWEMKVAWALLRICAGDPRFVGYQPHEIGRESCRERGEISGGAV